MSARCPGAAGLHVVLHGARRVPDELEQRWRELATTAENPFALPEWHAAWLAAHPDDDPFVLVCREAQGELVGVVPLVARGRRLLAAGGQLADWFGPACAPADEARVADAVVAALDTDVPSRQAMAARCSRGPYREQPCRSRCRRARRARLGSTCASLRIDRRAAIRSPDRYDRGSLRPRVGTPGSRRPAGAADGGGISGRMRRPPHRCRAPSPTGYQTRGVERYRTSAPVNPERACRPRLPMARPRQGAVGIRTNGGPSL